MDALVDKIINAINSGSDGEGISATFYRLSQKVGFKTYCYQQEGIWAYIVQQKLSELGMAPKVLGYCKTHDDFTMFTEIANEVLGHEELYPACNKWIRELYKGFDGWNPSDADTYNNIGYRMTFNGEPEFLCIDVAFFNYGVGTKTYDIHSYLNHSSPFRVQGREMETKLKQAKDKTEIVYGFNDMALPTVGILA